MVRIVSITKPILDSIKYFTPEEVTVYIARVSNPKNQLNNATAAKLIRYCIEHGHWSVFEHVYITVEIKTTRAIAAQILRHRSFTFQEFSQRYAEAQEIETNLEARLQDSKNRQNSLPCDNPELQRWWYEAQKKIADLSKALYTEALSRGLAKEQARFLLPLSTKTTLYMTGNLRSWIHYIRLRAHSSAQKEHRAIAVAIAQLLAYHFPTIAAVEGWHNLSDAEKMLDTTDVV